MMARIAEAGHIVHALKKPANRDDHQLSQSDYEGWLGVAHSADALECRVIFDAIRPDLIVVDNYALGAEWTEVACRDIPVMAIDDLANRRHSCDILLDQNLGREPSDYDGLVPTDALRLIGPSNALLRQEFARAREASLARRANLETPKNVMIAMGGMDRDNSTGAILDVLAMHPLSEDFRLSVVMGNAAPHLEAIKARSRSMPFATDVLVGVDDMASLLAQTDLAIGAAGGSAWERCCLGVPTLLLTLADNQRPAARALAAQGAAFLVGDVRDEGWQAALATNLIRISEPGTLAAVSRVAASLVDGLGTLRVTDALLRRIYGVRG
jgi:UDP-2,4-diacetamido-2,4,6-trideoxy-beta-L-altropyranose hydrolase